MLGLLCFLVAAAHPAKLRHAGVPGHKAHALAHAHRQEPAEGEAAADAAADTQTDMLRSLLLANSQMMYAINTLEEESVKMRQALDTHEAKLQKCESELAQTNSAQQQADADRLTLDQPSLDSASFSVASTEESYLQVAAKGRKAALDAQKVLAKLGAL